MPSLQPIADFYRPGPLHPLPCLSCAGQVSIFISKRRSHSALFCCTRCGPVSYVSLVNDHGKNIKGWMKPAEAEEVRRHCPSPDPFDADEPF